MPIVLYGFGWRNRTAGGCKCKAFCKVVEKVRPHMYGAFQILSDTVQPDDGRAPGLHVNG